jgi:hypothetical protein
LRLQISLPTVALAVFCVLSAASAQDIFVTPVPNAPFRAIVQVERSRVQPDGSVIKLHTIREIARDSRGRIHNESRTLLPESSNETPKIESVHLYDPSTRLSTRLFPEQHRFFTLTVNHPPNAVPPSHLASSAGSNLPPNDFTHEEDLGNRDIGGLSAHGIRETQTVLPEVGDKARPIEITDEYWYSEDLRINLLMKHSDPRKGTVTLTVGQISREEPDPALFRVPDGYKSANPQ